MFRSGRPDGFCKKVIHENFANFTGKHLCERLFFNKAAGLRPATLLKKSLAQVFSCESCEISKNTFFSQNTSGGCFWIFNFLLEITTSTQAIKLKFGRDKFAERTVYNLQARTHFSKKSRDQVDKVQGYQNNFMETWMRASKYN